MPTSTSRRGSDSAHQRGSHGGGDFRGGDEGGGGGGGGDDLVKVAFARTEPEAEMLQGLLSEAGIPSVLKRSGGFDNPDFLSAGPRDVYVLAARAEEARQVLADTMLEDEGDEVRELEEQRRLARGETGVVSPGRLAFWIGVCALAALALVWVLYEIS
jgi:Putative prokaryotic signal transducing protein